MPSSPAKKKPGFPIPWGLFIVLGVYGFCVYGYIWSQYWNSPEYQAAMSYANALLILGVDDGRRCSEADLNKAFTLTLEAARLMPDEEQLVEHLENLRHRFEERKFKLDHELVKKVEMMSANTLRIKQERKAWLVVGSRDRGWAPDQLLGGPKRVVLWSIPGGVLIIAFWAYTRMSSKAVRDREHEEELKKQEKEVEQLGEYRSGLGTKRPPPKVEEDDSDTIADVPKTKPPPKPKTGTANKAVTRPPSLTSRPAVKKRPPSE